MVPDLVRYLEDLSVHLRLNPLKERQVIREMYTHLEDRVTELEGDGLTQQEAVRVATKGFGPPKVVAEELYGAHGVGTWIDALLAASPYFGVFLLFGLHLWTSLLWLGVFMTASVAMTLIGWWKGKPVWMYPWAGFALVLPMASGVIAGSSVWEAGLGLVRGHSPSAPTWVLLGLLAYVPLSLWMVISVAVKVIRLDWIFASLMLLPFPIVVRWVLSLQFEGSAIVYNKPLIGPGADLTIATIFLALALLPVLFVRVRQRRLKIVGLAVAAPPAFMVAAYSAPGYAEIPGLVLFAVLAVLFLFTPALLDRTVGRGSPRFRSSLGRWTEQAVSEP